MKFQIDHDYHIHSFLSECSQDPMQDAEHILRYAEENGLKDICLTDHSWDESVCGASDWYRRQSLEHIRRALPLPQSKTVRFHFGCETDMDKHLTIGMSPQALNTLDFLIVPTTHLHMTGFTIDPQDDAVERRAALYIRRFEALLDAPYPQNKVGIAHLTCSLIAPRGEYLQVIDLVPDAVFRTLFTKTAQRGFGVELNMPAVYGSDRELSSALRPYRIAKQCGCKFYLGSDAHHPEDFEGIPAQFRALAELLDLRESDKFRPFG
ncbi:MAG: hypothetical protein IJT44_04435 [Clostridia bacterium]|nr:hypothetical protein [Clostridia bacterium]